METSVNVNPVGIISDFRARDRIQFTPCQPATAFINLIQDFRQKRIQSRIACLLEKNFIYKPLLKICRSSTELMNRSLEAVDDSADLKKYINQ